MGAPGGMFHSARLAGSRWLGQLFEILVGRVKLAGGRQLAVAARVDDVGRQRVQIEQGAARRAEPGTGYAGPAGRLRFVAARDHAQLRDPAVVAVLDPVLVGEDRETLRAPAAAPGVLHDEAVFVVADESERVAVVRACLPRIGNRPYPVGRGSAAAFARVAVVPAIVRERAPEQHAGFVERDLHVDHRTRVDAIVRAERPANAVVPPVGLARRAGLVEFRPERLPAHAVLEPALQRSAQRRATVRHLAAQVIVAARHAVEHERRDRFGRRGITARRQHMHDGRQRKAGARAGVALMQSRTMGGRRGRQARPRRESDRGPVGPVAEIDAVGDDVAQRRARNARLARAALPCGNLARYRQCHGILPCGGRYLAGAAQSRATNAFNSFAIRAREGWCMYIIWPASK